MMLRKAIVLAVLAVMACAVSTAQDKQDKEAKETSRYGTEESADFYKLEFTLRESDGAKVLNKHSYTLNVRSVAGRMDWEQLRSGTRVPLPMENEKGGKTVQYFDVGTNLDCRALSTPRGLSLQVRSEISSLPADASMTFSAGQGPLVRQMKNDSWVLIQLGKSTQIFTADEPTTSRRFELEVVATKL
jgi:hypothetical protein